MAHAQNNTTFLSRKPVFCGSLRQPAAGELTAEEFLRRVEASFEDNWDGARKIKEAVSGLQEDADQWYHGTELQCMGRAHEQRMKTDWDFFKKQFQTTFFKQRSALDTSFNWSMLKQTQEQPVNRYLGRVADMVSTNFKLAKETILAGAPSIDDNVDVTQQEHDLLAAIRGALNAQQIEMLNVIFNKATRTGAEEAIRGLSLVAACQVAQDGAYYDDVRAAINSAMGEGKDFADTMTAARRVEERLQAKKGGQQQQKKQQGQQGQRRRQFRVAEVDDDHHSDDEEQEVQAVAPTKQDGQRRKKNQQPKKGSTQILCNFCNKAGHVQKNCRTKKDMLQQFEAKQSKKKHKAKNVAPIEDDSDSQSENF